MKILHMADIHLGMEPDKGKPWGEGRSRQLWAAFKEAIEAAQEQAVELVLIAGDLFHRQPLKRELREVNEMLSRLTRARVVIMAGNHDYLTAQSFYRTFPWNGNISFFRSEQMEAFSFPELSTTVYGFSYEHREIRTARYKNIPKERGSSYHILLAHGGDENHVPLKIQELEDLGFDYIALGHIHIPQQMKENRIVRAGSLQPLDYTEQGPRGYWITELVRGQARAAFYPIRGCEYREVELVLDRMTTNYRLVEQAREALEQLAAYQLAVLVLRGVYDPETEPEEEALVRLPGVAAVENLCKPDYDFEKLKQEYRNQIVGRYIRELEAMPQEEVTRRAMYLGVDALLSGLQTE